MSDQEKIMLPEVMAFAGPNGSEFRNLYRFVISYMFTITQTNHLEYVRNEKISIFVGKMSFGMQMQLRS